MRDWWLNLSFREKQTVALGALALSILFLYLIIWAPLANKLDVLSNRIQHDQTLLKWMRETDKQIKLYEKNLQKNLANSASLLSIVQDQLNKSPFAKNVTQLHQADAGTVQMNLDKVSFDKLLVWLNQIWNQHQIFVEEMSVTPSETPGVVQVNLVLSGNV